MARPAVAPYGADRFTGVRSPKGYSAVDFNRSVQVMVTDLPGSSHLANVFSVVRDGQILLLTEDGSYYPKLSSIEKRTYESKSMNK